MDTVSTMSTLFCSKGKYECRGGSDEMHFPNSFSV
uniref:Uncharacterized protein n=1 Tax=Arundo donax TaxID=35708 RepID=A0A0A8XVG1_ARUDO